MSSKKNKIVITVVAVIAVAAIAFFGVRNQMQKGNDDKNVIKIGAIIFLTGPQAASGRDVLEGLQVACQELSRRDEFNGKKIKLLIEDSKDSPKEAITAFNKLVSQNCSAIISAGDVVAFNLAPLAEKNKIPLLTVITEASDIPQLSSWVHRVWIPDHLLVSTIADFISSELKSKQIAVLAINNEFGLSSSKDFSAKITKHPGIAVVSKEYYGISDKDLKSHIAKSLSAKPDTVFVIGFGEGFGTAVNQLRELGFKGNICCSVTMAVDYYQKQTAKSNEGVFFPAPPYSEATSNDNMKVFAAEFQEQMKHVPSFTSAFAYESLKILASVIRKHGDTRNGIQQGLTELPPQKTVFGKISYNKNRDIVMDTAVFKMHNGKPVLIKVFTP